MIMADDNPHLTGEEQRVLSRLVGRRAFLGVTAGATLSALAGREPRRLQAQTSGPTATADAVIVLWMAGGMGRPNLGSETVHAVRDRAFAPSGC